MPNSADRVQAYTQAHEGEGDDYELDSTYLVFRDDGIGETTTLILGDLRYLEAERKALWEVVRAAKPLRDKIPFLTCTDSACTDPSHRALGTLIAAFDLARAELAKLEKE